jgi:hypothetical protein
LPDSLLALFHPIANKYLVEVALVVQVNPVNAIAPGVKEVDLNDETNAISMSPF